MKLCRQNLREGKSVVIDNTNPSRDVREAYLKIAKECKAEARCIFFDTPKDVCIHNNEQRGINTHREHASKMVPMIALHMFFKNVIKPQVSEGFESVITVNFVADLFQNNKDKDFYSISKV